jgi:hypothetical protein
MYKLRYWSAKAMNKSIVNNQNKVEKSNRYSTARGMAGFITVMGWLCAAVGALLLINSGGNLSGSSLAAAAFIIPGLLIVAGGQVIKALLDIANNSWEMAENTQQILANNRQIVEDNQKILIVLHQQLKTAQQQTKEIPKEQS